MEITKEEFIELCHEFLDESGWNLTFQKEYAEHTYKFYTDDIASDFVVIRDDEGKVMAAAILSLDYFAHIEPFGYIVKFYVRKGERNGKVAIKLIELCNRWFDDRKTVACFVSPLAKIGTPEAAIRLLGKMGYKQMWMGVRDGIS